MGGVQEAGEEGAGSRIPKVVGSGRKRDKLCSIAQYFAIEKTQRGGSAVHIGQVAISRYLIVGRVIV